MKHIILDTNFILSCVRKKIDFFEEIKMMGFKIAIPNEVINEIKRLGKPESEVALKIIDNHEYKKVELGKGHVDKKLIIYAKENPENIVATLDKELRDKLKNRKLIIRGAKKLEIIQ